MGGVRYLGQSPENNRTVFSVTFPHCDDVDGDDSDNDCNISVQYGLICAVPTRRLAIIQFKVWRSCELSEKFNFDFVTRDLKLTSKVIKKQ